MDDNINVDMNNKTEDIENAVESDNAKETLEDIVLQIRSWGNSFKLKKWFACTTGKRTNCRAKILATKITSKDPHLRERKCSQYCMQNVNPEYRNESYLPLVT